MIQIGGVYITFCQERAYFCKPIAIEMGGVSRYFSKVSGSGVDVTLLKKKESPSPSLVDRNEFEFGRRSPYDIAS